MNPVFQSITDFPRGTLSTLLRDGYSFDGRCEEHWGQSWIEFDNFFYDNPRIAETCGFMSAPDGNPIGFVSWDPRRLPVSVEIGHNCIASTHKGHGFGTLQMREAVRRISRRNPEMIIVTTSGICVPARHMYQSAGFVEISRRENHGSDAFSGEYIDYRIVLR